MTVGRPARGDPGGVVRLPGGAAGAASRAGRRRPRRRGRATAAGDADAGPQALAAPDEQASAADGEHRRKEPVARAARGQDGAQEVRGHREQDPAEDLLDALHPHLRRAAGARGFRRTRARKRYGRPRPSERTKKKRKPRAAFCRAATNARSPRTNGPTQGAATTPTSRPIAYAPAQPGPRAGLLHESGRHPDVVEAEHRERERDEDERRRRRGPTATGARRRRAGPESAGGDAERRVRRRHSEDVDAREAEDAAGSAPAPGRRRS